MCQCLRLHSRHGAAWRHPDYWFRVAAWVRQRSLYWLRLLRHFEASQVLAAVACQRPGYSYSVLAALVRPGDWFQAIEPGRIDWQIRIKGTLKLSFELGSLDYKLHTGLTASRGNGFDCG